jgi:hypothetical protein
VIFGHAPIIVPALLDVSMTFRPTFYVPPALLHFSLLLRVVSALAGGSVIRRWGGLRSVIVAFLFLVTVAQALQGSKPNHSG